jgi:hypothetical protein
MKDKLQGYAHLTAKIDSLQEQLHLCNVDQLSTAAELAATIAQRDKALAFLQVYRNDTPLGHQPHMIAHEVDPFLKDCGK